MGPSRYERVVELGSRCLLLAVMDIILSQRLGVPRTFTSNNYYYGILLYALWCLVNVSVFLVVAVLIVKPTRQLVDSLSFVVLTVVLGLSYAINEPLLQDSRGHVTGSGQRPEVKVVWLDDVVVTVVVQVALASVYVFVRGRVGWRAAWQADGRLWPAAWCVLFCLPAVLQLCSPPVPLPAAVGWLPTVCASLAHGELLVVLLLQIPRIVDSLEWQLRRLLQLLCNPRRLQLVVHGQWSRLRVPTVLGTYWALRLLADLVLVVARARGVLVQQDDEPASESAGLHPVVTFYDMDVADDKVSLYFRAPGTWTNQTDPAGRSAIGSLAWSTARSVLLRGCDGILPLVGMTTVVSAVGRHVGRLLTVFLDVDDGDAGSSLGTMCGVLFFVLALQTGLTRLAPHRRLVRLARNLCLLGTAVLHFAHGLVHPMLLVTGASPAAPTARHARPLVVCALLLVASPIGLLVALWSWHAGANPWLLAVTVFSLEVLLKVTISLLTYGLLLYDARCQSTWERLDDYIYYLEAVGNGVEFLFGVFLFGNGTWILVFESQGGAGSLIRVCMMSIHAYYNIYWAACECWRALARRRAASAKIDALPAASSEQLAQLDDICSICHGQLTSAVVTTCGHFFHGICLRKWLYQHDRCPLCHQPVGGTTGMQRQKQQQQQQRRQQRQEQPEQQPQQQPGQQQQEQPEQQRLQQPEQQPQQQPEQQRLQQPEQQPQQQPEQQQQEQPEQQQQEQPEQQQQEQPEAWWPAVDDVIHPHLD